MTLHEITRKVTAVGTALGKPRVLDDLSTTFKTTSCKTMRFRRPRDELGPRGEPPGVEVVFKDGPDQSVVTYFYDAGSRSLVSYAPDDNQLVAQVHNGCWNDPLVQALVASMEMGVPSELDPAWKDGCSMLS